MSKLPVLAIFCLIGLAACSSGSSTSGSVDANAPAGANATGSTLFSLPLDTKISVVSNSASRDETSALVTAYSNDFWLKSRDAYPSGDIRRIRYGKPRASYHPRRNYTIPVTITDNAGQSVATGSATFSGTDVESGVTSRTITLDEIQLNNSIFGLFSADDTGTAPRGDYFEVHAYAAGVDASSLPALATYSGDFIGDVISDGSSGNATRYNLEANLDINFSSGTVSGDIGNPTFPDIILNGSMNGNAMSGTAVVGSNLITLTPGTTGRFQGGVFGDGASEAAGTLGISDTSGAINHEIVGAFGTSKN